jgi:hypothetical protein
MVWWKNDPDIAPPSKEKHNSPRVGDAVYIEGQWILNIDTMDRIFVKSKYSRVNGHVVWVDHDTGEVRVHFTDHPYADREEPLDMYLSKDVFYGQWSAARECFVLRDSLLP